MELKGGFLLLSLALILQIHFANSYNDKESEERSDTNEDDLQQTLLQESLEDDDDGTEEQRLENKSRFPNPQNRVVQLTDACLEPKSIGKCKLFLPRYYFNQDNGHCERFAYGGCGGNGNNFQSLIACEKRCSAHLRSAEQLESDEEEARGNNDDICELPPSSPGQNCRAYLPRWTYNAIEQKCINFIYSGCGATANMYLTKYSCQQKCGNYKPKITEAVSTTTERFIDDPSSPVIKARICNQPLDVGLCFGMNRRYYFNKESNRCLSFTFNGCGGNDNNFQTAEECLRMCGGSTPADNVACTRVSCPMNLYIHYTSLGCQPIYDGNACCPTRYDCQRITSLNNSSTSGSKCQYKGKFYTIGEEIEEASSTSACRAICSCVEYSGKPRINCASIECPENLGARPPGKENCTLLYRKGSCCAHDYHCPIDTLVEEFEYIRTELDQQYQQSETHTLNPVFDNFRCIFEGKEYVEGERIQPKEDTCRNCICQKGFNGTLTAQFCEPVDCGIEIYYADELQRGCVPVYFQDAENRIRCCPIGWECPDEHEQVPPPPVTTNPPPTDRIPGGGFRPVNVRPYQVPLLDERTVTTESCPLPRDAGHCKSSRPRYYFNLQTKVCEPFTYGGCGGNKNNFVSLKDCQNICEANAADFPRMRSSLSRSQSSRPIQPKTYELSSVDECTQEPKLGPCKGYFRRFYFSPELNGCRSFVFGGCRGNKNNFFSIEACSAFCQNKIPTDYLRLGGNITTEERRGDQSEDAEDYEQRSMVPKFDVIDITPVNNNSSGRGIIEIRREDPCGLPPAVGMCKGMLQRFYYDVMTQTCKPFTYGGCGGNENNFVRLKECEARCVGPSKNIASPGVSPKLRTTPSIRISEGSTKSSIPVTTHQFGFFERCSLPMQPGSCFGNIPSFYYNVETQTCKSFIFGGCFGNANRFSTLNDCEAVCKAAETQTDRPSVDNVNPTTTTSPRLRSRPAPPIRRITSITSRESLSEKITNSEFEILQEEKEICSLLMVQGNCRSYHLRFYWNSDLTQCLPFVFSGCSGNKNNFLTESDCLSTCGQEPPIEKITQEGVLTCPFGNETYPLGGILGGPKIGFSCGLPLCQCITPPALTCIQKQCPPFPFLTTPIPEVRFPRCPVLSCLPGCRPTNRPESGACPSCDCDNSRNPDRYMAPPIPSQRKQAGPCPMLKCHRRCRPSINQETGCPLCDCSSPRNELGADVILFSITNDDPTQDSDIKG